MDQLSPRFKTTKDINSNMKFMVNMCVHNICDT